MTVPKWLIPVLAVVATLALGVAAVFIGFRFASPDVQTTPTDQVTVPVIAPFDPHDGTGTSAVIGTTTVTEPGSSQPDVPQDQQDLVDAVLHSDDPRGTAEDHSGGTAPAGDPCSPPSGPAPAGCPAGAHGSIRSDLAPLWVNAQAFPPASSPRPADPVCPVSTPVAGTAPIGVSSSAPAHYEIEYWWTGDPSSRVTATADTAPEVAIAYATALADPSVATTDLPVPHTCLQLFVDRDRTYSGQVVAIDADGHRSIPAPIAFSGAGADVHPELEVSTIGENLLVMSAVARDDQRVEFYLVGTGASGVGSCDSEGTRVPSAGDAHTAVIIPDSQRIAQHWPDRFTVRFTQVVALPFGTTALVCARWFDGTDFTPTAPWDPSVTPLFQSRQVVMSPDKLVPTLTTGGFSGGSGESFVTVSTTTGVLCRGESTTALRLSSTAIRPTPFDLCSATFDGTVHTDISGRYWTEPVANYFAVTTETSTPATTYSISAGVPAPLLPCVGACAIPDPQDYRIAVGPARDIAGWWGFQLVYRATAGGNRSADWALGGVASGPGGTTPSSGPTFDTAAVVGSAALDPDALTVSATVPVTTDQPVDYEIRAFPAEASGPRQCPSGPAPRVTGHLDGPGVVTIPGLCVATGYALQITLVDATGHRGVWSSTGADPSRMWPGARFVTAGLPSTLHYTFTASGVAGGYVSDLLISLEGTVTTVYLVPGMNDENGQCLGGDRLEISGEVDGSQIASLTELYLTYRIRTPDSGGGCTPAGTEPMVQTTTLDVISLRDLLDASPEVTVTGPSGAYTLSMSLTPTP